MDNLQRTALYQLALDEKELYRKETAIRDERYTIRAKITDMIQGERGGYLMFGGKRGKLVLVPRYYLDGTTIKNLTDKYSPEDYPELYDLTLNLEKLHKKFPEAKVVKRMAFTNVVS